MEALRNTLFQKYVDGKSKILLDQLGTTSANPEILATARDGPEHAKALKSDIINIAMKFALLHKQGNVGADEFDVYVPLIIVSVFPFARSPP